jgi:hypothetical protein
MMFDRLRSDLNPLRHDDPPRGWWDALLWVPVGYAVTRLLGDTFPAYAMVLVGLLAAAAHHYGPAVVETVAGGLGLIASGAAAWDGAGCQAMIGDVGVVVIIVFGSIFIVSSFVRLIGSASLREMGKHLVIATATIEVSLFLVGPRGEPLIDPDEYVAPALLAAVLMGVSQLGLVDRYEVGMLSLGAMLVPVQLALALGDNPCGAGGFGPLLGMLAFAGASYSFASVRPLPAVDDTEGADEVVEPRRHRQGYENGLGVWVDATPDSPVWSDPDPALRSWVDHTPDTGVWLDDDYEDEFRDEYPQQHQEERARRDPLVDHPDPADGGPEADASYDDAYDTYEPPPRDDDRR